MFTVNPPCALSALLAALLALALFINGVAMMGGADRVARFIVGVMAKGGAGVDFEFVMVNGAPDGSSLATAPRSRWLRSRPTARKCARCSQRSIRTSLLTSGRRKARAGRAHASAAASGMHTSEARLTSDARKNIFRFSELYVMMLDWMGPARRSGRSLARPKAGGENGETKWLSSP